MFRPPEGLHWQIDIFILPCIWPKIKIVIYPSVLALFLLSFPIGTLTSNSFAEAWNEWTFCPATCGKGIRTRTKTCSDASCPDREFEVMSEECITGIQCQGLFQFFVTYFDFNFWCVVATNPAICIYDILSFFKPAHLQTATRKGQTGTITNLSLHPCCIFTPLRTTVQMKEPGWQCSRTRWRGKQSEVQNKILCCSCNELVEL